MRHIVLLAALLFVSAAEVFAQQLDSSVYQEMRWRMIGPFRGGRTKAAVGVPDQPNVFYVAFVNGGVWKSTDYGRVWKPIFDDQPTGSVGAIAVAPSNPNIIYVGSGEGLQRPDLSVGDGIYKSTDAGVTWTHLGLRDGQQIPMIVVDPRNPDRLFVAVLGHPYGANTERGIFRSTDGGKSFQRVLYRDENTGGIEVQFDPSNADVVYAALWEQRQGPWENGVTTGKGSGFYKSTDGGNTWKQIGKGLPSGDEGVGRIGFGMSPSQPNRLYAVVSSPPAMGGIYRSDDGGENWQRVNPDPRLWSREGDFNEIKVDPTNADVAYVANIMSWKTSDGGKTFQPFRGAPGGDDPQRFWINPNNPNIIMLAGDQGVMISVNRGETWSSWYNQPTAQLYHVTADNSFPYRVCGGQQESGSVCIQSRGDYGRIAEREWTPVGVEEYGYVAPDPLDPDIIYGGKITRYDRRTKQAQNISPKLFRAPDYRLLRTAPVLFAPTDPHTLYFASNVLWKTTTGGNSWVQISPDLARRSSHPGVIYTIAPSYIKTRWIWVGTDDGLIHVTPNGGTTWRDVTPAQLRNQPWSKISLMDASHFDTLTAYAAVNTLRLDDLRPHIYRTRDGGKTWQHITNGIPDGATINVVKEDHQKRGLLFAGSEKEVFVSFDDGDHWQSLRRNMPATSIRDLIVKDNDVVVATHGRSFWILDDISPLRQVTQQTSHARLFKPATAIRFRWNKWPDTPLPPEEPYGENPPDGAVIDYQLSGAAQNVTLEILRAGKVVRTYSSADAPEAPLPNTNVPPYWVRPPQILSAAAGTHRFVWDLHYERPAVLSFGYPISASPMNTVPEPRGVWAMPGAYTVRLTVDGKTYEQPLNVRMDPRVKTSLAGLQQQFTLSMQVDSALRATMKAGDTRANNELASLFDLLQEADTAPTTQLVDAVKERLKQAR
ncbi:MAG TPA: hypothetical protein VM100_03245 [Longimicrobiales bacterium]|nr:hypothetical protein [Longimicrobiales bacterium]